MSPPADTLDLVRRELASAREEREAISEELAATRQATAGVGQALLAFANVCQSAAAELVAKRETHVDVTIRVLTALAACAGLGIVDSVDWPLS